jgi:hypothetical protein
MPNDPRERFAEGSPILLAWGMPAAEASGGFLDQAFPWLAGGAALLVWTAVSLLLTS